MNLLRAELSRLRYRRRTLWSLVGVLLISLMVPALWMDGARPLGAADHAEAAKILATIPPAECPDCSAADYLRTPWTFGDVVTSGLMPYAAMMGALVLLIVMLYVSSDLRSGAISTQLTFTPRRWVLVAARTAVAALLGGALMATALVTSTVVSAVWFVAMNGYSELDATTSLLALLLSASFYGAVLGAVGALLTVLLGGASGAGALLVGVFVANVLALWIGDQVKTPAWLLHLMPTQQGIALLHGSVEGIGTYGDVIYEIRRTEAVVYHLVATVLIAAVTVPLFERRDIRS
ncbi:hypothetical protein [Tessaracoccus sp. G1721]